MDLRNPKHQKMLMGVVLLAALLYLYFLASFLPFGFRAQASKYNELKQHYEKLTLDLSKARQLVGNLPRLKKEYEELHESWLLAKELLPEEKELATLLSRVTIAGQQSGVKFTLFKPNPPVDRGYYVEHPVEVSVVGGFHETAAFLSEIANLSRIVNVSGLKLASYTGGKPDEVVQATFIASAYTLTRGVSDVRTIPTGK
ncbi:MAG: type 4a pilus biogenesis protein PilO [Candidatus Eisenbacteria bacterium]|nr:type 4a pilus biogenesis protein PilO [Candidatus Eisenbacteria bacterium]